MLPYLLSTELLHRLRASFGRLPATFGRLRDTFGRLRATFGRLRATFARLRVIRSGDIVRQEFDWGGTSVK